MTREHITKTFLFNLQEEDVTEESVCQCFWAKLLSELSKFMTPTL